MLLARERPVPVKDFRMVLGWAEFNKKILLACFLSVFKRKLLVLQNMLSKSCLVYQNSNSFGLEIVEVFNNHGESFAFRALVTRAVIFFFKIILPCFIRVMCEFDGRVKLVRKSPKLRFKLKCFITHCFSSYFCRD